MIFPSRASVLNIGPRPPIASKVVNKKRKQFFLPSRSTGKRRFPPSRECEIRKIIWHKLKKLRFRGRERRKNFVSATFFPPGKSFATIDGRRFFSFCFSLSIPEYAFSVTDQFFPLFDFLFFRQFRGLKLRRNFSVFT